MAQRQSDLQPQDGLDALGKMTRYVEAENLDAVHTELRAGRPVVLLLSHIGPWELAAQLVPHYAPYARIGSPYQRLGNRYIDRDVSRRRARTGSELFDRSEGFHKPIELLRSGGLLGIFADQHAGDHGLWTPRNAPTARFRQLCHRRVRNGRATKGTTARARPAMSTTTHRPLRCGRRSASRPPSQYPIASAVRTVAIVFAQTIVEAPK